MPPIARRLTDGGGRQRPSKPGRRVGQASRRVGKTFEAFVEGRRNIHSSAADGGTGMPARRASAVSVSKAAPGKTRLHGAAGTKNDGATGMPKRNGRATAPGQVKKTLGLQSARTLTPAAARKAPAAVAAPAAGPRRMPTIGPAPAPVAGGPRRAPAGLTGRPAVLPPNPLRTPGKPTALKRLPGR